MLTPESDDLSQPEETRPVQDDRLSLIFTCCHPALSTDAQVALTLRLLGGLTTKEVARSFLVTEPTMATRLARAKRKIKAVRIPYRVPEEHELPDRLRPVLAVIYLIYTAGQTSQAEPPLCAEAIRLARILATLMPDEPEVAGLLALLLLTESRRASRIRPDGSLALLGEQDRSRWDRSLIEEGQAIVRACLRRNHPGPYQLQAAINAVHADAPTIDQTDWSQIVALYDHLLAIAPTPIVALNRAIAIGEVQGAATALALVDQLDLDNYHPFHATRADLLHRLHRNSEAAAAYERAAAMAPTDAEREFLRLGLVEAINPIVRGREGFEMLAMSAGAWLMWILVLAIWVALAFWPARVAGRKGHSFFWFFVFSLFFFPAALIVAYVVQDRTVAGVPAHA